MLDKYDEAVEYLTQYPEIILGTWKHPHERKGGCLFKWVTPSGHAEEDKDGNLCGCPAMIRGGYVAITKELTNAIRNDTRLPNCGSKVTVEHLPIFAEWQRRIDQELGRTA